MTDKVSLDQKDHVLGFTIPSRDARGRIVRLSGALDEILAAHDYTPALQHALAEALLLTALMGSLLKDGGDQLTIQAQGKGGLANLMVCDYRDGAIRGYIEAARDGAHPAGANVDLPTLFGTGHLAVTFDLSSTGKRYQGVVPLEGASLSAAIEAYFAQSEQVPTLIRTAVRSTQQGMVCAGMLVQHLPEGEVGRERLHVRHDDPQWEHVSILASSIRHEELLDTDLSLQDIVWRLYHEEETILVSPGPVVTKGCRCSVAHFEDVLSRFPSAERREMADENGIINVDCAFCSKLFAIQD